MQQGLLIEFSCNPHYEIATLQALLACTAIQVKSGCYNTPTVSYSNNPLSRSSNTFFFQMSADSLCIYDSTHYICSSTDISFIFILKYSLHAVINLNIFPELPSNSCGLATSTCMLGYVNITTFSAPPSSA